MNFITPKGTYVKSNNSVSKINRNYLYTLIFFTIYLLIYNLILKDTITILNILKTLLGTTLCSIATDCFFGYVKNNKSKITSTTISIALIITIFNYNGKIMISIIAALISIIAKYIYKNISLSCTLYGIIAIYLYRYYQNDFAYPIDDILTIKNLINNQGFIAVLFNNIYITPIVSLLVFFYLFYKKSIKYNIYFSYILTYFIVLLLSGLLNHQDIYYFISTIISSNIFFFSIYLLPDYGITPEISRGQIIYGIILGIITSILTCFIPNIAIIITLIIGPIIFTKYLDNLSIKLKYNEKYYMNTIYICISLVVVTIIILKLFK